MPIDFISKYRLKKLYKKHPKKVCAFLGIKQLSDETISSLHIDIVAQLLSLSKYDWEKWTQLLLAANTLQDKYKEILENEEYLEEIYTKGAENARKLASKTLEDVKNKIGIL